MGAASVELTLTDLAVLAGVVAVAGGIWAWLVLRIGR